MEKKIKLTAERVRSAKPPEPKPGVAGAKARTEYALSDAEVPGLALRVLSTGVKSYIVRYRIGKGRGSAERRVALGRVEDLSLADARRIARQWSGDVAGGGDPAGELRAERAQRTVSEALDAYDLDLSRRHVVRRKDYMSALRRGLAKHLRKPLAEVSEAQWKGAVHAVEDAGRAGAAAYLRTRLVAFLGWAKERGELEHHPLAGWRRPRATRAERLNRAGRALPLPELALAWSAAGEAPDTFRDFLRLLMLTGQRRTETARMRWRDVNAEAMTWTIPAAEAKNGVAHGVPLGPKALELILAQPKFVGVPWVFSGRTGEPISGWSKRMRPVEEACAKMELERWTPHDLRRSFRSGLSELGVLPHVSEAMLNHVGDELTQAYDRSDMTQARREAALRWEAAVLAAVEGKPGAVVALKA